MRDEYLTHWLRNTDHACGASLLQGGTTILAHVSCPSCLETAQKVLNETALPCSDCTYLAIDDRDLAEHRRLNHKGNP